MSKRTIEIKKRLISESVKRGMKDRKLSRLEFSKIMQVQPSIITRWLSGSHNFTIETLFNIEEKLGSIVIVPSK